MFGLCRILAMKRQDKRCRYRMDFRFPTSQAQVQDPAQNYSDNGDAQRIYPTIRNDPYLHEHNP